ncbi:hypothetical protein LCM19_08780 [Qipengyuania flava]|nr:hypothetical protein [Qipengyuania flava]
MQKAFYAIYEAAAFAFPLALSLALAGCGSQQAEEAGIGETAPPGQAGSEATTFAGRIPVVRWIERKPPLRWKTWTGW